MIMFLFVSAIFLCTISLGWRKPRVLTHRATNNMNKQISRMNKIFTSLVFLSTSKTDGSNESSGPLIRLESVGIFVSECSSVYDVKSHYLQKLTILSWAQPCWNIVRHKLPTKEIRNPKRCGSYKNYRKNIMS